MRFGAGSRGLQSFEINAVKGDHKKNLLAKPALDGMFISEPPLVLFCSALTPLDQSADVQTDRFSIQSKIPQVQPFMYN
jgi:hypothetical protein